MMGRAIATAAAALALAGSTALAATSTATAATAHAGPGATATASARAPMPAGALTLGEAATGAHAKVLHHAAGRVNPAATWQVTVIIKSLYTVTPGQCLDADANNGADGTKVQVWRCNGSAQQLWNQYSDGRLESVRFPGMCLDADATNGGNGTRVQLWQCNGTTQQVWFTRPNDAAIYNQRFYNNYNTVLDRDATDTGDGARAQLWTKNWQSQQWWDVIPTIN
ncbi:RICIN domain-containing protein [Streptacidiphilus anmyonensis]|uniref:RICIN domain-containing protein n=1 Tax=Streptacidiphilus anmyonensis TaxID=405782 RepID=UPI0006946163|nr:RICIN domain-containing protein [Streptacidiphilus anmyonensis]